MRSENLKENHDVKRSLEFTQDMLETAKSVIKDQQQRIEKLEAVHANSYGVSERLRTLEDYSRRNNIIVDGVMEEDGETTEKLQRDIEKPFSEKNLTLSPLSTIFTDSAANSIKETLGLDL